METMHVSSQTLSVSHPKRIEVIDVLRGFALLGIIVNHIEMGFLAGMPPPGLEKFNIHNSFDQFFNTANALLTFGKFFTIFSFLFGLSFAIQMDSSIKKGSAFTGRFIWRLAILFFIGFIHNMFFSGDILVIYAVLGLLLVLVRNWSNKTLLIVGCILVLNFPLFAARIFQLNAPPSTEVEIASQEAMMAQFGEMASVHFQIKKTGTLFQLFEINAIQGLFGKFIFQIMTGRLWITFGLFLLGLYAGRKNIFADTPENRSLFHRLARVSGIVALFSTTLVAIFGMGFGQVTTMRDFVSLTAFDFHQASLSAFYLSLVVILYWETKSRTLLNNFAPVGKMGLTTYLMQSMFGLAIFYGIGLGMLGEIGSAASIILGVMFFVVQIIYSRIWLSYFSMGPIEWLWRAATYFNKPPFRKIREDIVVSA